MKHLLLISLIFLISCKPTFEKDGGTRLILEASTADKMEMDKIIHILTQRLNASVLENSNVRIGDKPELIVVEIPGKIDLSRIRQLLQSQVKLEFWETFDNKEMYEKFDKLNKALSEELYPELKDTVEERQTRNLEGASLEEQFAAQKSEKEIEEEKMKNIEKKNPVFFLLNPAINNNGRNYQLMDGPVVGMAKVSDTAKINLYLNSPTAKNIFGSKVKFLWTHQPMKNADQAIYQLVAIKINRTRKPVLYDEIVKDANVTSEECAAGIDVSVTMTQLAGFEWEKITRSNIGKAIAIVIDDQVYSYPIVNSEISGGVAVISGNFTMREAKDFANILKAGYLPVPIRIVAEEVVAGKK